MSDKFETIKTRGGHMTLNVTRLKDYQEDKANKKAAKAVFDRGSKLAWGNK
jgi:hypothetical protein